MESEAVAARRLTGTLIWVAISACLTFQALAGETEREVMDNAYVVRMVEMGLGESLILAKIDAAEKTAFATGLEEIVFLKEAGVSEGVIEAMVERGNRSILRSRPAAPAEPSAAAPAPGYGFRNEDLGLETIQVALEAEDGEQRLRVLRGEFSTIAMGMMAFVDYPGLHARVRTSDRSPALLVRSRSPLTGGRYFWAKLDSDTDDGVRSLKISSAKGRLKSMFGNSRTFLEPDHDWVLEYEVEDLGDDLWRVTPKEPLAPGEYGWYVDLGAGAQQATIFDFGVDESARDG